ncbi:MAG: cysteine--tRNA ligase [Rickettsiales bacterium]|jgi:cysteinyl-tRNA synthetase|nr:cysteine--tRNA ligase [Rickettsiales bacterium]
MDIKLYNTMGRAVETFKPLVAGEVRFYSCGPTVYHYAHIGNLRTYVSNDILKRMFMANGYKVRHVMNITDVGHLTSDSDTGDDKMEKGSKRTGKSVWDVAKFYTDAFMRDIADLNIIPPSETPRATGYIAEQIAMVKRLEELGYTYKIDGDGIYYDTSKFPDYGRLGGQSLAELKAGARVDWVEGKRNVADFALWKFSPPEEKRQMEWDSPWGVGFPGWHIECSAMSLKLLGDRMDIHTGGVDHIKVHHTNEIAQTEPVVGHKWVNCWLHMEHLNDMSGKMSKSNGQFLTLSVLKERGYDPMAYRYYLLLASYRTQINFSFELLDAAKAAYENLLRRVSALLEYDRLPDDSAVDGELAAYYRKRMLSHLNNDLSTAGAIVVLHEALKDSAPNGKTKLAVVEYADEMLGLKIIERARDLLAGEEVEVKGELLRLVEARISAKEAKDWARADSLRLQIESMGYVIEDAKDGARVKRKI